MKKKVNKFTKFLLLIVMIISDLMTPISVLADTINVPNKGDVGINNAVSGDGTSVTVQKGSLTDEGDVLITKTVSKTDTEGKYTVSFNVKGKDVKNSTEVIKPVYVVIVFDRSGSMESGRCMEYWGLSCIERNPNNKWENAVSGAQTFAKTLLSRISNAQIALVGFSGSKDYGTYNDAEVLRKFESKNLDNTNFGSPDGGTNLYAGLYEANKLLNSNSIPNDAYKYVVVISDGQPTFYYDNNGYTSGDGSSTTESTYNATMRMANTVKENAEVFAVGYSLPRGNVYGNMSAADILKNVATADTGNVSHYVDSDPDAIANAFTNIASEISKTSAGTNAVVTDTVGSYFEIATNNTENVTVEGDKAILNIGDITEEGTTLSFDVLIDQDAADGWVDVNNGFKLTYTDAKGNSKTVNYEDADPQVYWERNTYNYIVNYYKDSFETDPIASDTRSDYNGTVINKDNALIDKYLDNNNLGTVGYEFNSINPESITVSNSETKVINILYTIKKFDYVVNYFYADDNNNYSQTPDSSKTVNNVNYGTSVKASDYYLSDSEIREGYKLDTDNSDNNTYTITDGSVAIDIYYKRDNYNYTVKYYFDNKIDNDFTKNPDGVYGNVIYAKDNYLNNNDLNTKNNKDNNDYFLDTNNSSNTSNITIGTDSSKNVLNIYYISTFVTEEDITKNSTTDKITDSSDVVNYTVNYNSKVNNLRQGQKVTVVVTDTLPYAIDKDNSNLNDGVYNSDNNNTITWTFEETADKFYREYNINKKITYSVVYKDFAGVSVMDDNTITNSVKGTTTTGGKTTVGAIDEEKISVEIKGNLIVHHYEKGTTNSLYSDEKTTGLVGSDYNTSYRNDILGYSVDSSSIPSNKDGKYIDGTVEVTYYYVKNNGKIVNPNTDKTGPKTIDSVDGEFDYNITATGSVKDYVGSVKLIVTDNLPYKLDTAKSVFDKDKCNYDGNKTITCTKDFGTISEEDYTNGVFNVNETFNLKLVFVGIESETVVNSATSTIKLDTTEKTTDDETETVVEKGNVTAIYVEKDNESNVLAEEEPSTGLVGTDYTTDSKYVFGYTLVGTPDNQNGKYTEEDIIVKYLYTKNEGTIDTPVVVKEGPKTIDSVDGVFDYTITAEGTVKDYVGSVKLTVTDNLPYAIDTNKSTLDKRCSYDDNKTITCVVDYGNITEKDYTNNEFVINEVFTLKLVFVGIDSSSVVNKATSKIELDTKTVTTDTEVETEVLKGQLVVEYVSENGEELAEVITTTDLAGTSYMTEEKEFFGYTLKEIIGEEEGIYVANETVNVKYVYSKNVGTNEEEILPPQTGIEEIPTTVPFTILMLLIMEIFLFGILRAKKEN